MTTTELRAFLKEVGTENVVAIYCDNDKVAFYHDRNLEDEDIVEIGGVGYFIAHETMLRENVKNGTMDVKIDSYIMTDCIQGMLVVKDDPKTEVDREYLYRC